jgi:hypothetical protein
MVKVAGTWPPIRFSRYSPPPEVLQLLEADFGRGRLRHDDSGVIMLPSFPERLGAGDFTYIVAGKIKGRKSRVIPEALSHIKLGRQSAEKMHEHSA